MKSIDKIDTYIQDWNKYYNNHDFNNMEKVYKKMENELKNVVPIESTLNAARQVENLHNLIKNNGKNFNLSQYEIDLANKLA